MAAESDRIPLSLVMCCATRILMSIGIDPTMNIATDRISFLYNAEISSNLVWQLICLVFLSFFFLLLFYFLTFAIIHFLLIHLGCYSQFFFLFFLHGVNV